MTDIIKMFDLEHYNDLFIDTVQFLSKKGKISIAESHSQKSLSIFIHLKSGVIFGQLSPVGHLTGGIVALVKFWYGHLSTEFMIHKDDILWTRICNLLRSSISKQLETCHEIGRLMVNRTRA